MVNRTNNDTPMSLHEFADQQFEKLRTEGPPKVQTLTSLVQEARQQIEANQRREQELETENITDITEMGDTSESPYFSAAFSKLFSFLSFIPRLFFG